jgi:hypothetical protein
VPFGLPLFFPVQSLSQAQAFWLRFAAYGFVGASFLKNMKKPFRVFFCFSLHDSFRLSKAVYFQESRASLLVCNLHFKIILACAKRLKMFS